MKCSEKLNRSVLFVKTKSSFSDFYFCNKNVFAQKIEHIDRQKEMIERNICEEQRSSSTTQWTNTLGISPIVALVWLI